MRKFALFLCLCAFVFGNLSLAAQTSEASEKQGEGLPHFILAGLQAYKDKGPEEAMRVWIKDSPIDGSRDALTQSNNLHQVQDYYGAYQTHEVIAIRVLSPRTRVIYLVMDFDKGPLFCKFVVYRSEQGWTLTNFNFNTKEEMIVPSEIGFSTK